MPAKHTPGPWRRDGKFVWADCKNDHGQTVNRFSANVQNDNGLATFDELDANASLIAAAPDLYEFVARFVSLLGTPKARLMDELMSQARAAIAKAEGK